MKHTHEMRLIDKMLREQVELVLDKRTDIADFIKRLKPVLQMLPLATTIAADDVTEYYYAISDKEQWHLAEIPNIIAPFPIMFIETIHPSRVNSPETKGKDAWHHYTPHRWGALMVPHRADDSKEWSIECFIVEQPRKDSRAVMTGYLRVRADETGSPRSNEFIEGQIFLPVDDEIGKEKYFAAMLELVKPLFLAVSFMHCKNVPLHTVEPPAKLVRAHKRRGNVAPVTYRTINIEPFRQHARRVISGRPITDSEAKRALHLMRGHFKTFNQEKPLLGKHTGTFWWNPQMRGAAEHGRVEKSYTVKGPEMSR